jgi:type I restriction enzyme S subunit
VLLGLASISPNGGFKKDSLKTYGGPSPEKLILAPGDMYVSLKDVTQSANLLGAVSRVPQDIAEGRLTQDTVKLVFTNASTPQGYIYWLLRTPQYRNYCRSRANGTTNLSLSREDFLSFAVPDFDAKRALLVQLLQALEDKIELNRRMNETLEEIARALFKSWFVDFGPVRAKMEGRQPFGMDDETATLFPDSFEDSALGEIPKGWSVKPLDQVARFLNGLALQKYPPEGDEYLPAIKIAELRKGVTASSGRASTKIPPQYVVEDGDVLFSWSGSLEVQLWTGGRGALNQHLFKVTSERYPKWFYYYWIKQHLPEFRAIAADKATTMGHIKRHHLTDALVTVPPEATLQALSGTIEPIVSRMPSNDLESRTLAAIRDALLPKLLSGGIRVGEAEEIIEETA